MSVSSEKITDNHMPAGSAASLNDDERKKKKRIIAIIIAAVILLCAVIGFFLYNNVITAVTMRIQRLVGTVNLYNENGAEQSLREKMRLGAGQTVTTGGQSLIMVSLDDTKLMTMEESSKAEIKARGKKLQFDLLEGNLFFNVTEKLKDNEEFDVHTSTMICGIRGTSAYVGRDATGHEILMVTDGLVHVDATNPVTKEATKVDVPPGQMITIYLDEEAEGNKTISIRMSSFKEEDLPALALDTMRKNKALMDRVAKATGFSTKKLTTLADLSSTKGVSMFGSAANDLRQEGIEDAIPYMGNRAHEMVASANSAVNIARDDLPLEVAIIQGYRDVMDVGIEAGYDEENLGTLMRGTRDCMERTFVGVDRAGLRSLDRINVARRVGETLRVSAGRMTGSNLSTSEIDDVLDAEAQLFEDAVDGSAADKTDGSKGADVLSSLDKIEDHITGTVDEEMDKESNGEETVIALLGGKGSKDGKSSKDADSTKDDKTDTTSKTNKKAAAGAEGDNGAGTPATGNAAPAAGNSNKSSRGSSSGGATTAEIKNARATIVATDPNTGIVALADGTLFDPVYYAAANPDVVAKYGTSTEALLAEWLKEGKAQGRPPIAPPTPAPEPQQTWSNDDDSSGSNDDDEDEDEEEEEEENNSTPVASPTPTPPVSTGEIDGNLITLANGKTGENTGTGTTTIKMNEAADIAIPLTLTPPGGGAATTLNGFENFDWANTAVGTSVTNGSGDVLKRTANNPDPTDLYTTGGTTYTYRGAPPASGSGWTFTDPSDPTNTVNVPGF